MLAHTWEPVTILAPVGRPMDPEFRAISEQLKAAKAAGAFEDAEDEYTTALSEARQAYLARFKRQLNKAQVGLSRVMHHVRAPLLLHAGVEP